MLRFGSAWSACATGPVVPGVKLTFNALIKLDLSLSGTQVSRSRACSVLPKIGSTVVEGSVLVSSRCVQNSAIDPVLVSFQSRKFHGILSDGRAVILLPMYPKHMKESPVV